MNFKAQASAEEEKVKIKTKFNEGSMFTWRLFRLVN